MTAPALTRPLSFNQQKILDAIWDHWAEHRYAPTTRDLMERAHISSTSVVAYNLVKLRRYGLIDYDLQVTRSIVPLGDRCPCCGRSE